MGFVNDVNIVEEGTESPDILLRWDDRLIGVEHTECYRGFSNGCTSAKTENTLKRIVEEAVGAYSAKGGVPLTFGVAFNGDSPIDHPNSLAAAIGHLLLQWSGNVKLNPYDRPEKVPIDRNISPEMYSVNHIFAQSVGAVTSSGFVVSGFHTMDLGENRLAEVIADKAARLNKYRQRCDEVWLLVALPRLYLTSDYALPHTELGTSKCGFDRVFVLDVHRDKFSEVSEQIGGRRSSSGQLGQ